MSSTPVGKNVALLLAAGLIIVLLLAGGLGAYRIWFQPTWTEQLPFKNSTGQFETIVVYRNATDGTYSNLTTFLGARVPAMEAAIALERQDRPVEHAVALHDAAEREGINCSLLGLGLRDSGAQHAVAAFYTTDRGMTYVDLTARNVSAADYPGIDFSRVDLRRESWTAAVPFRNATDGHPAAVEHRNATPVTYDRLLAFLSADDTEKGLYVDPEHTCLEFGTTLHNEAEAEGIRCGVTSVTFEGRDVGHAFAAFPTTDRGIVYVDSTGFNQSRIEEGDRPTDNAVYIEEGKELGELPITQVDGRLDYNFYLERRTQMQAYMELWTLYGDDMAAYNAEVGEFNDQTEANDRNYTAYRDEYARYEAAVKDYNRQMDQHNQAMARYNAGDHSVSIPPAPTNLAGLQAWTTSLEASYESYSKRWNILHAWKLRLDDRKAALISRHLTLVTSEEYRWVTYQPMGIVKTIQTYWG